MWLRRPINANELPRHTRVFSKRLMNTLPQRRKVRVKGTNDDACVFDAAAVQADKIPTIQRQQNALLAR